MKVSLTSIYYSAMEPDSLMAMSNPAVVYLSLLFDVTDIEAVCVYVCEREGERKRGPECASYFLGQTK